MPQETITAEEVQLVARLAPLQIAVAFVFPLGGHTGELLRVATENIQLGLANLLLTGHGVLVLLDRRARRGERVNDPELLHAPAVGARYMEGFGVFGPGDIGPRLAVGRDGGRLARCAASAARRSGSSAARARGKAVIFFAIRGELNGLAVVIDGSRWFFLGRLLAGLTIVSLLVFFFLLVVGFFLGRRVGFLGVLLFRFLFFRLVLLSFIRLGLFLFWFFVLRLFFLLVLQLYIKQVVPFGKDVQLAVG